jgi:predicted Holliday junction resolvase-like endonuclease
MSLEEPKLLIEEEEEIKLIKATLESKMDELESRLTKFKVEQEVSSMSGNRIYKDTITKIEEDTDKKSYRIGTSCTDKLFATKQDLLDYLIKESGNGKIRNVI